MKAYTVADESKYVIVQNIPSVGGIKDLIATFALYGTVLEYNLLDHLSEEWMDAVLIKFADISAARLAKSRLDGKPYCGYLMQISYSPACETLEETREKLLERARNVTGRLISQRPCFLTEAADLQLEAMGKKPKQGAIVSQALSDVGGLSDSAGHCRPRTT